MIEIMCAKQAYDETKYRNKVNNIIENLIKKQKDAISQGHFSCAMDIPLNTAKTVREMLIEELTNKGYMVEISDNEQLNARIPNVTEQGFYFDSIKICWDKNEEKND